MVQDVYETERLIIRKFGHYKDGTPMSKEDRAKEVERIFKSWYNPQNYRYNEITWDKASVDEMFDYKQPTDWGMYYRIAELKGTGEIVATCRFGKYYGDQTDTVWDFGYNVFRDDDKDFYPYEEIKRAFQPNGIKKDINYWGKGYAKEILEKIIEIAIEEGRAKLYAGVDMANYGSQKVMIANGFVFSEIDEDNDPCLELDLSSYNSSKKRSQEEIALAWSTYLKILDEKKEEYEHEMENSTLDKYYSAIGYMLLERQSKLCELIVNNNSIANTISKYIEETISKLDSKELVGVTDFINTKYKFWSKKISDDDYKKDKYQRYIKYVENVKKYILKISKGK